MKQVTSFECVPDESRLISLCIGSTFIAASVGSIIYATSLQGEQLCTIEHQDKCIVEICQSSVDDNDGETPSIVCGSSDGYITKFSLPKGQLVLEFPLLHSDIFLLKTIRARLNDNIIDLSTYLVSSSVTGDLALWNVTNSKLISQFQQHAGEITQLQVLPDERTLATGISDGSVRLWDLSSGNLIKILLPGSPPPSIIEHSNRHRYAESVSTMLVLSDGRILAGGIGGMIRVYDFNRGELIHSFLAHSDGGHPNIGPVINNILKHPKYHAFVTSGTDGRVQLWDLNTYSLLRSIRPQRVVSKMTFYQNLLVFGGKDGGNETQVCGLFAKMFVWDLTRLIADETKEMVEQIGVNFGIVSSIKTVKNGQYVVSICKRNRYVVQVWS